METLKFIFKWTHHFSQKQIDIHAMNDVILSVLKEFSNFFNLTKAI